MRNKRLDAALLASQQEEQESHNPPDEEDDFYHVVVPTPVTQWRTQAKLAVAPRSLDPGAEEPEEGGSSSSSTWSKNGCMFGLYKRGTHQVLCIPDCAVHHPSMSRAVQVLELAMERAGVTAYEDDHPSTKSFRHQNDQRKRNRNSKKNHNPKLGNLNRSGGLRYVQLQVERCTDMICLTLVWSAASLKETQPALARLLKELQRMAPHLWHSIWCRCNETPGMMMMEAKI